MVKKIELTLFDLEEFSDIVWGTTKEVGKEALEDFKKNFDLPDRTGLYISSMDLKIDKKNKTVIVFENAKKKNRRIIGHLLENGTPEMPADPHWSELEDKYITEFEKAVREKLEKRY